MKLSHALTLYEEHIKNNIKSSSYITISTNLKHIMSLRDYKLSDIHTMDITKLIQKLQKENKHKYVTLQQNLKSFFNFCIKELGVINKNPVNIIKNKKNVKRKKYISKKLYNQILKDINNKDIRLFIKVLYNTGMRISEVRGLQQDDIKNNTITVSRQLYKKKEQTLKTSNSYRTIPINKKLYKELKQQTSENKYIFSNNIDINAILKKYDITPHCFRYTYATNLVSYGINIKIASQILGDEFETFVKIYVISDKELEEKEFKKIQNML